MRSVTTKNVPAHSGRQSHTRARLIKRLRYARKFESLLSAVQSFYGRPERRRHAGHTTNARRHTLTPSHPHRELWNHVREIQGGFFECRKPKTQNFRKASRAHRRASYPIGVSVVALPKEHAKIIHFSLSDQTFRILSGEKWKVAIQT